MHEWKSVEKPGCPLGQQCPLGLTSGTEAVKKQDHERLMRAVFGDGNGNEGIVTTMNRREAQLSLLFWLFGPSSILGLLIAIATLIIELRQK